MKYLKNTPEGINSRITETEERISELAGRVVEITAMKQCKEKRMNFRDVKGRVPRTWLLQG